MFSEIDKKKAMTIVRIFETGKITGDYSAVAVLDDGAGISYGISQFTHRSGSLATVVQKYLSTEANVGRVVLEEKLPLLKRKTPAAIRTAAADTKLKAALKAAAITSEMRQTQDETAEQLYLQPAMDICASMGFTQPLSLAVIYDSLNHGSWERIRDQVPFSVTSNGANLTQERLWITTYVRKRDAWLASVKRLAVTRYRTQFFLLPLHHLQIPLMILHRRRPNRWIIVWEKWNPQSMPRPKSLTGSKALSKTWSFGQTRPSRSGQ